METQFNQPKRQQIIDAYRNGTDEQKKVLVELFGEIEPKNVMERVKTFDDACRELGEDNEYVKDYRALFNVPADVFAYYQLRIICAALNEGWKPDYTDDEQPKYVPYFFLCDEDFKKRNPGRTYHKLSGVRFGGNANNGASCGLACSLSHYAPSTAAALFGSRLCLKSRELALHVGKYFFDICKDFYF
jgi:hypothetical protein